MNSPHWLLHLTLTGGMALAVFAAGLARPSEAGAQTTPAFATAPVFGAQGLALSVFNGGWRYQLLVIGGPSFVKTTFKGSFPSGFTRATAVTIVRSASAVTQTAPAVSRDIGASVTSLIVVEMNVMRAANGVVR